MKLRRTSKKRYRVLELDDKQFYDHVLLDLKYVRASVIFGAPYVTHARVSKLRPYLEGAISRGCVICVFLRPPDPNSPDYTIESYWKGVAILRKIGVHVTIGDNAGKIRHEKFCFFDCSVLYLGSLNILSNNEKTSEYMQREVDPPKLKRLIRQFNFDQCADCKPFEPWTIRPRTIEEELKYLGAALRTRREELGLKQCDVEREVGINQGLLSKIEAGNRNITFDVLCRVSMHLGIYWRPIPWHQAPAMGKMTREKLHSEIGLRDV